MQPATCAILDPDAGFRRRLREWLERADEVAVVGEARDEPEARELIAAQRPHIFLADLDALGNAEGVARIAARFPETRLLILHRQEERAAVLEALRQGAWGHLAKEDLSPEEVVEAVRMVAQGEACLSPRVAGWLVEEVARRRRGA
ncbi:MAG: response regulator [Thermoflexales bacterium]|nr:response regulator [Thermoflexales bacterium]